jgi:ABC-type antimicrobial peptide transport system permease subunit
MKLARIIRASFRILFAHRMRAILALSSVSIGVAAVLLTAAIGAGAQQQVEERMNAIGTNLIVVRPAQVERLVSRTAIRGVVSTLKPDDFLAIATLPFVAAAAPGVDRPVRAKVGNSVTVTKVLGTSPAFPAVRNFRVRSGRFFDADDDRQSRLVAVLGAQVGTALYGNDDPVGREIRLRGVPFEVIGVLESKGVLPDGSDEDNQILVPIRTALRRVINSTWLTSVYVSVNDPKKMNEAKAAITALVRERHGREDFAIQNTSRFMAMQKQATGSLTTFATGLGGIALLVGGTGILAFMMMSVKERTDEIGLRMAVGATPRDVLTGFLVEATLIAGSGWLAGVALGAIAALAVALGTKWTLAMPVEALLVTMLMVLIAGLGFGVIPARKASLMPPMVALRLR